MPTHALAGILGSKAGLHGLLNKTTASFFRIAAAGTTSAEIPCSGYKLTALLVPDNFTGAALTLHGKVRSDQSLKPVYQWVGGTRTQVKLTDVAAGNILWFPEPIEGFYSLALEAASQTYSIVIVPRFAKC